MPAVAAIGLPALFGGIAGLTNRRPPSLDTAQKSALTSLLTALTSRATAAPSIDPAMQSLLYGGIAESGRGSENRITNALTARGLGDSGLLAQALTQNALGVQRNQNQANFGLLQQSLSERDTAVQQLLSALHVEDKPGQSGIGAFLAGAAGPFAGSGGLDIFSALQSALARRKLAASASMTGLEPTQMQTGNTLTPPSSGFGWGGVGG